MASLYYNAHEIISLLFAMAIVEYKHTAGFLFPLYALFCSLEEVGGAGRVAPQKLTITAAQVEPVLPYNERTKAENRIVFLSCSPFSAAK